MTGDQVYNLIRLALYLGLAAFILFGVYRLVTRDERSSGRDGE